MILQSQQPVCKAHKGFEEFSTSPWPEIGPDALMKREELEGNLHALKQLSTSRTCKTCCYAPSPCWAAEPWSWVHACGSYDCHFATLTNTVTTTVTVTSRDVRMPPKNGLIAIWSATNRWYVVKCVSQKRNWSNNILVTLIPKLYLTRYIENAAARSWSWSKWGDRGGVVILWKICWHVFLRGHVWEILVWKPHPFREIPAYLKGRGQAGRRYYEHASTIFLPQTI